jgi:DNA topoisomerase-1
VSFRYRGKNRSRVRSAIIDEELAEAMKGLLDAPGGNRLFRYKLDGEPCNLTGARLNDYIGEHMGEEFTAKDFRTWGGTLLAAIALAEHGPSESDTQAKTGRDTCHAVGRRKTRKHACGCTIVLRQPSRRRAVSWRENH